MWHLAANIPDGLIFGIVPTVLGVVFGWGAWITLLSTRTESRGLSNQERIEKLEEEKVDDHERRLRALEATR